MTEQPYDYRSHQASLLKPYYHRWLWDHILRVLPTSLSPNAMTVLATLCCGLSFLLALAMNQSPLALCLAAALILAYLSLDNLDGAQARRVGKSTRLGEFLDHWLDTMNNGFVVTGACVAAHLPPLLTLAVLCCGSLAFYSVQWELRNTGVFRMGRIADIEGNTTVALLYVGLAIFGQEPFHASFAPGLPSLAILIGCGVMAQALWTALSAVVRAPRRLGDFAPLVIASLVLFVWALRGDLSWPTYLAAAVLLNPVFTSGPIRERLQLGEVSRVLDWSVVAGISGAALLSSTAGASAYAYLIGTCVVAGLAVIAVRYFLISVSGLRGGAPADEAS